MTKIGVKLTDLCRSMSEYENRKMTLGNMPGKERVVRVV